MLEGKKHIHFIGIGGSGMAPLAEILHDKGYYLTGSDNNPSDTLDHIKSLGIPVFMGQSAKNIQGADLIVHTAAIMSDNEELIAAKNSGVPVLERSELFGIISKQYSNAVCVCGTHGKTTTTAMLTQIVLDAGLDPTAVIGGKLASINGNGRVGKSDLMVCEACEFVDTFLKLYPDTCIMLNIDEDHMDYFKTMDNLIKSFNKFASMATKKIIANGDDPEVYLALKGIKKPIITFGYTDKNDYYSENIVFHKGIHTSFDFMHNGKKIDTVDLYVPGRHNVLNATAVIVAAIDLGIPFEKIKSGMKNFKGAGRRFEVLGVKNGVTYVDDYAHHPAEIKVTLEAAKSMGFKRVIAVHQPFTFSRTKMHLDYFAQ
ncbi:MAG: UDP-N-acetylmuramate--L-alanine ligase, partial [Oscillospiraceae bacterium]